MKYIEVKLLDFTPIHVAIVAARTCYDSFEYDDYVDETNIGQRNTDLLERLTFKYKHESVIEHIKYTFTINGISRLCLQQLARHRIASFSVQSTRYTLKRFKKALQIISDSSDIDELINYMKVHIVSEKAEIETLRKFIKNYVEKFLVIYDDVDNLSFKELQLYAKTFMNVLEMFKLYDDIKSQDKLKYFLPESWRTSLVFTINARSFRNFLNLRLKPDAHFEIRHLAKLMLKTVIENIPNQKILYKDLVDYID